MQIAVWILSAELGSWSHFATHVAVLVRSISSRPTSMWARAGDAGDAGYAGDAVAIHSTPRCNCARNSRSYSTRESGFGICGAVGFQATLKKLKTLSNVLIVNGLFTVRTGGWRMFGHILLPRIDVQSIRPCGEEFRRCSRKKDIIF